MIKAIICDFDGTLADTFSANFQAYQKAFYEQGLTLPKEIYRAAFGLRYDDFIRMVEIEDLQKAQVIRERKKELYPHFFHLLQPNTKLIELVRIFHQSGGKTAIASTARTENLLNVVAYLGLEPFFDVIQSGNDVSRGKPNPEIYLQTMKKLNVQPTNTLIFEDTEIGIEAAHASGAQCIKITKDWFGK